ncbi:MAG: hypothetical protein NTW03_14715 [Verrucomicrobia bacterium]|nr:hypothetical protein [Verrucomicrobiota bacterium]
MQITGISEKILETLIMLCMTGGDGRAPVPEGIAAEISDAISAAKAIGSAWLAGHARDYDRAHVLNVPQLLHFLRATQLESIGAQHASRAMPSPSDRACRMPSSVWHARCYNRLAHKVRCRLIRMLI